MIFKYLRRFIRSFFMKNVLRANLIEFFFFLKNMNYERLTRIRNVNIASDSTRIFPLSEF